MFFSVDPGNGVPVYDQIVRQVKYAVADGTLADGQRIPSVRQLAADLALNPNTIARAYTQLQQDGVVESLRGRGMVVAPGALALCQEAREELIARRLESVVREALAGGLSVDRLHAMVADAIATVEPQVKARAGEPTDV